MNEAKKKLNVCSLGGMIQKKNKLIKTNEDKGKIFNKCRIVPACFSPAARHAHHQ